MFNADMIFLHAPSIFDFRKRTILHGPISDVVPSGPMFEMYPIGLVSLSANLEASGFSTRIINVANKMLKSKKYSPEAEIRKLRPKAFGIDLHWFPHVQGSLALGELVKRIHPDIPIIYGGYSSTFFHEELITYPFIDFVMRGDSTEEPTIRFMRALTGDRDFASVPNLTWKDASRRAMFNELSNVPNDTEIVKTSYELAIKKTVRYLDLNGYMPFKTWFNYPVTAVFLYRGCLHNCKTCGGSRHTCEHTFKRTEIAAKRPADVARELKRVERYINAPCMIIGDIMLNGRTYALDVINEIGKARLRNEIAFEFFVPPTEEVIRHMHQAIPKYNVEISPESHDESVRRAFGRPFNNEQMERSIEHLLTYDCRRIDLFFMTGLPKQTYQSVMDSIDYCEYLMKTYGAKKSIYPFISPLAPFVDPGSIIWENPEEHGYRFFYRTVEEHRRAMDTAVSWKYFLNYETQWMTRDEIVYSTYEAGIRLNELKRRFGLIAPDIADMVDRRARLAVEMMRKIEIAIADYGMESPQVTELVRKVLHANINTVCYKDELNWPSSVLKFNLAPILGLLMGAGLRTVGSIMGNGRKRTATHHT